MVCSSGNQLPSSKCHLILKTTYIFPIISEVEIPWYLRVSDKWRNKDSKDKQLSKNMGAMEKSWLEGLRRFERQKEKCFVKIVQNVICAEPNHGVEKTQAEAKHCNEIMTIVVTGVKMDFHWFPKASGYASVFVSFFQD